MSEHAAAVAEPQKTVVRTDIPVQPELLPQQKCACGATAGFTGACSECGEQRLSIQRRAANSARPASAPGIVEDVLQGRGEELDDATRGFMESRFGHDFSHVRVHTDARAAESARAVGALAYTVGQHVVFAAGHYQPRTNAGQHLIAHELTHTMQQGERALAPQAKLEIGEERDELEKEADNAAERVMKGALSGTAPPLQPPSPLRQSPTLLIQRAPAGKDGAASAFAKAESADAAPKTLGLIVEDEAEQLAPGQMRKSEFLAELRREVCDAADAELVRVGRDTESCPYITRAFAHYQTQDSQRIERSLRRYAPEAKEATTARGYISAVSVRVARAVGVWAETGEVSDVPEELAAEMSGTGWIGGASGLAAMADKSVGGLIGGAGKAISGLSRMFFKERAGGARAEHAQAAMMHTRFDEGQALDANVRSRMESAFGHDFSRVRVYADSSAAELSTKLNARAFTVGQSVGFGAGEYRPGTAVGDALIAHELAHVVQQDGTKQSAAAPVLKPIGTTSDALEEDADEAAIGAVASIWGGFKHGLAKVGKQAMPRLKSGLQLQRCGGSKKEVKAPTKAQPKRALTAEEIAHARFRSEKQEARDQSIQDAGKLLRGVSAWASGQKRRQDVESATQVVDLPATEQKNLLTANANLSSTVGMFGTRELETVRAKLNDTLKFVNEARKYSASDDIEIVYGMRGELSKARGAAEEAMAALEKTRDTFDGYEVSLEINEIQETISKLSAGKVEASSAIDYLRGRIKAAKDKLREAEQNNERTVKALERIQFLIRSLAATNAPGSVAPPSLEEAASIKKSLTASLSEDFQIVFKGKGSSADFALFIEYGPILERQFDVKQEMAAAKQPAAAMVPTQAEAEAYFSALAGKPNDEVFAAYRHYAAAYYYHRGVTDVSDLGEKKVEEYFARKLSVGGQRPLVCSGYAVVGSYLLTLAGATLKKNGFINAVRATDTDLVNNKIDEGHAIAAMTRKGKPFFISNDDIVFTEDDGIGPEAVAWNKKDAPCYKAAGGSQQGSVNALVGKLATEIPAAEQRIKTPPKKPRDTKVCR